MQFPVIFHHGLHVIFIHKRRNSVLIYRVIEARIIRAVSKCQVAVCHMEDCGKLGILGLHEAFIFRLRLQAKAGLTGYAQVYGKYNTTPYDKLKLDMLYIENYSFWLDIKILLMTFKVILQKENSEGIDENQITALKREIESKTTTKY